MRNQLRPALFLLAVAAPLLSPAGGSAQPPATSRDRDARAAFAFAASFARQHRAAPSPPAPRPRPLTLDPSPPTPHPHEDDGVRVWQSTLPTYYPSQPEPPATFNFTPIESYLPAPPFAPVMQRGVSGVRCVTVGGRTS
jgi:hypothetical protein